ncbi:MAG: hypothetical protein PUB76_06765 [Oscillospiraceae bacterium]|nr:hypothetical protein [Oscillospiraceae bacterium]
MKNTKNRLSFTQIYSILLVSHIFSFICFKGQLGAESLIAVFVAFLIRTAGLIAVYVLYQKGFSLSDFIKKYKSAAVFLYFYIICMVSVSFIKIRNVAEDIYMPVSSSLLCTFLIIAVCSYTSSLGIRATGSISLILFILSAAVFIIIPMTSFENIKLSSVYFSESPDFILKTSAICSSISEPLLLLLYMPFRKEKTLKYFNFFPFLFLITDILLCVLCISLLHRKSVLFEYPFFAAVNTAQPFEVQRADAFYSVIFILVSIFRITCLTVPSSEILRIFFPKLHLKSIFTLILSGIFSFVIFKFKVFNSDFIWLVMLGIFILLFIFASICKRKKKNI